MPLKHPLFGCNGKFMLLAAHGGPGMQPGHAEASPIEPKKLVSSSARTLCERVRLPPSLPSRIVTVAVKPDQVVVAMADLNIKGIVDRGIEGEAATT
jgi:hypothetical protein